MCPDEPLWPSPSAGSVGSPAVALTGTPSTGQVPTATGAAAATWQTPAGGGSTDTAPADIFIATTGSDSTGNGTVGNPYATLAKALSVLPDVFGIAHTIHVADGTYAEPINLQRFRNDYTRFLTITGNTTTPTNVKFTGTVNMTQLYANPNALVATANVTGNVYVTLQGLTLQGNGTATYGLLVQDGPTGRVVLDRCQIQTSAGNYTTGIGAYNATVELRGNNTVQNWTVNGLQGVSNGTFEYTVAGTLTLSGPAGAGGSIGIHLAYHSKMIHNLGGTHISMTGVQQGWQLGLHGEYQSLGTSTQLTINNASTPGSSAGINLTDQSTWSSAGVLNWTNLTQRANVTSLSYAEATGGSNVFTGMGGASSTASGGVIGSGLP